MNLPRVSLLLAASFGLATAVAASDGSAIRSEPSVSAGCAIVMDAESGRILWGRNIDLPRYPASTTKVMTGLLLLERCKPDDIIVAPPGIEKVDPSSMHLRPGERVAASEMLYALMLRSANDGSVAVAQHISGSVSAFADLMNQRAVELGCTHTHFANPNGLNNPHHVTTAHDLALIAREAMTHPEFREVVKQSRHKISRSMNQKDLWMVSKNKLIREDKTVDGIKTGWTVPAGHCYVGSAFRNGYRVITVVLKSSDWKNDDEELVNWAYSNFEAVPLDGPLAPHAELKTTEGGSVNVTPPQPVYALVPKGAGHDVPVAFELAPQVRSTKPMEISGAVTAGQQVGYFVIGTGDSAFRVPAIAQSGSAVLAQVKSSQRPAAHWTTLALGLGLAGGAVLMRRKSRLSRSYGS